MGQFLVAKVGQFLVAIDTPSLAHETERKYPNGGVPPRDSDAFTSQIVAGHRACALVEHTRMARH